MNDWARAGIILIVVGALLVGGGIQLVLGRVRRPLVHDYRLKRTPTDDPRWYAVNGVIGFWFAFSGVITIVTGGALLVLHHHPRGAANALALGVLAMLILLLNGISRAWRIARTIDAQLAAEEDAATRDR